ncbi:MAG: tripartite tricarboxylate transporter substrate binding protein [Burkholderiales bacterium]
MRIRSIRFICAALAFVPLVAGAQGYPTKPVRFIVPFAAGGATDISARIVGQKLGEMWGQTVVIDNRGGAAGNIGGAEAAKAPPDGYTLFFTSGSVVTANEHIYANMPFNPAKDFVAVTNVVRGAQVVVVPASSPYKTLKELIAAAKAKPGGLNYGHAGIGSQTHLAAENLLHTAKIEVQDVPYKGEGPAVAGLVGEQTTFATPNVAAAINFITSGKLRALAVTSKERAPQLPDVPTVAETLPGFENYGWFGLVAPAGTPREVVLKVYRDTVKALDSPEMRARFYVQGMETVGNSPEDFTRAMAAERARWAVVVKERRISVK